MRIVERRHVSMTDAVIGALARRLAAIADEVTALAAPGGGR